MYAVPCISICHDQNCQKTGYFEQKWIFPNEKKTMLLSQLNNFFPVFSLFCREWVTRQKVQQIAIFDEQKKKRTYTHRKEQLDGDKVQVREKLSRSGDSFVCSCKVKLCYFSHNCHIKLHSTDRFFPVVLHCCWAYHNFSTHRLLYPTINPLYLLVFFFSYL